MKKRLVTYPHSQTSGNEIDEKKRKKNTAEPSVWWTGYVIERENWELIKLRASKLNLIAKIIECEEATEIQFVDPLTLLSSFFVSSCFSLFIRSSALASNNLKLNYAFTLICWNMEIIVTLAPPVQGKIIQNPSPFFLSLQVIMEMLCWSLLLMTMEKCLHVKFTSFS